MPLSQVLRRDLACCALDASGRPLSMQPSSGIWGLQHRDTRAPRRHPQSLVSAADSWRILQVPRAAPSWRSCVCCGTCPSPCPTSTCPTVCRAHPRLALLWPLLSTQGVEEMLSPGVWRGCPFREAGVCEHLLCARPRAAAEGGGWRGQHGALPPADPGQFAVGVPCGSDSSSSCTMSWAVLRTRLRSQ